MLRRLLSILLLERTGTIKNCSRAFVFFLFFTLLSLKPFFSFAQFPYGETFLNSTTNRPLNFGGDTTALLTAGKFLLPDRTNDPEGQGYLRLTNFKNSQKGFVYSDDVFLGNYGLNIEFDYFTYGADQGGADGVCFFLFDATVPFSIGGFGGSLGYAQKDGGAGVPGAYLGVGLDEFGNFSNSNEDRQGDAAHGAGFFPSSVTLRGAGNGPAAVPTNYPLLITQQTTALNGVDKFTLAGKVRGALPNQTGYRKVFINLTPRGPGLPGLLINVSIQHDATLTKVINNYPYTTPIPPNGLKYGISSSTGGDRNFHEIRGLSLTVDTNALLHPEALPDSLDICQGTAAVIKILDNDTKPNAQGEPNVRSVDLDPTTPAIEQTLVKPEGTFVFDQTSKNLTFTPVPGFSGTAEIEYSFKDVYGSASNSTTVKINIKTPKITSQSSDVTVCQGGSFSASIVTEGDPVQVQWQFADKDGIWKNVPDPDGSLGATTKTLTINNVPLNANGRKYMASVTSSAVGSCVVFSQPVKLTVNPLPTVKFSPISQNECVGSGDVPVTFLGSGGTGVFTFTYTITSTTASGTVTSNPLTVTTNGSDTTAVVRQSTAVAGTFVYRILSISNSTTNCSNIPATRISSTILATPDAAIALTPASGTAIQKVCIGTAITPIIFKVSNADEVDGPPNPIVPGVTWNFDSQTMLVTISGTPTVAGTFSYKLTASGICAPADGIGSIQVVPNAAISLTSGTDGQSLCVNNPLTSLAYTVTNGTGATITTGRLPNGLTAGFNALTNQFTITGTPSEAGDFTYTITATGGCLPASVNGTIHVKPNTAVALTNGTDGQSLCVNTALTGLTYTVTNGTGATITNGRLPNGLTAGFNALTNQFTITGTPSEAGDFSYTITATGDCLPATIAGTIHVKPNTTIALTGGTDGQSLCVNTPLTSLEYTVTNGTGATITNGRLPNGLTAGFNAQTGKFTISGSPTEVGDFSYTITATGDCLPESIAGTIHVKPNTTIALTGGTDGQSLCVNTVLTSLVYTVTNGTGATITNGRLPAGLVVGFDAQAGTFTISGTPSEVGDFSYTITATGDCAPATISGTIHVKPNTTVALTGGTDGQSLCVNIPLTSLIYTLTNGTGATITNGRLPLGVSGNYDTSTGKFTISGTPSEAGDFNYTITATGDCLPATVAGTIHVKPNTIVALTGGTDGQRICVNTALTSLVYTVTNGTGATITAGSLPAGLIVGFDAQSSTFTISGTPSEVGDFQYTLTATGDCAPATISGTIHVKPNTTVALTGGTDGQRLCVNTPLTSLIYTLTNGTGATITNGRLPLGVSGNYDTSTGKFTISGSPTEVGDFNYTITATGDCLPATVAGTIHVKPNTTIALTTGTDGQSLCVNNVLTTLEYIVTNGTGATITAGSLPAGLIVGFDAQSSTFTISGRPTQAGDFQYTITATGDCAPATITGTIHVKPNTTVTLTGGTDGQSLCINTPLTSLEYTVTNGTGATITSGSLPNGLTAGFNAQTGKFTITGTPSEAGDFNYTVTATGDCLPAIITGTIHVKPNTTISLTGGTDGQRLCVNALLTNLEYTVTNGTGAAITSGRLPNGLTAGFDAQTGKFTISGRPTEVGDFTYIITATGDCAPATINGVIHVKPNTTVTLTGGTDGQRLCINTPLTSLEYTVTNGTGATITSGSLPNGLTAGFNAQTGKFTITGTPSEAGDFNYTVTATGDCLPAIITGTIHVKPNTTISLTGGTDGQRLCVNTLLTNLEYTVTNGTGAAITSGRLSNGLTAGFDAQTGKFTISGRPTEVGDFTYIITATGDCLPATITGTIHVKPNTAITLTGGTDGQSLCINTTLTSLEYTVTNGTGATITSGRLPLGVNGNYDINTGKFIISGTPTESGDFPYVITATGDCLSTTITGTIRVKPNTTISLTTGTDGQSICINTALNQLQYTVTNGTNVAITSGRLPLGVSGNFNPQTGVFTISGRPTEVGDFTYIITATGDCLPATITGTIHVKPNTAISLTAGTDGQSLCINTALTSLEYTVTNGTGATITSGRLPLGVNGNYDVNTGKFIISGIPTESGDFPYVITATGDCLSMTITGTIHVKPNTAISLTAGTDGQTLCINTALNQLQYTVTNGTNAAFTSGRLPLGVSGNFNPQTGVFTISGRPTETGDFPYVITATGDCLPATITGTIHVKPNTAISLTAGTDGQSLCINTALTSLEYTVTNGTGATITSGRLPLGVNGNYDINTGKFIISGTPTESGDFPYVITATGDCLSTTIVGTIHVKPNTTISLTAGTDGQTLCINTLLNQLQYTVTNGTNAALTSGRLPLGVSGNFNPQTGIFTISGRPAEVGDFTYTITATGDCLPAIVTGIIHVKPNTAIALTSGSDGQILCINTALNQLEYTVTNGTNATLTSGRLPLGVSGNFDPQTGKFTISGTPTEVGDFSYIITATGDCVPAIISGIIHIKPNTTITLTAGTDGQSLCVNTALNQLEYTVTNGTNATLTSGRLPLGVSGSFNPQTGKFTITGRPAEAGDFTYTITATGDCSPATIVGTIHVKPNTTIALTSGTDGQSLCLNTALNQLEYTVTNGTNATLTSGRLPLGVNGNYDVNTGKFTISGTPTEVGDFSYIITATGDCLPAIITGTIHVKPNTTIVLTAGTDGQNLCINTALTSIEYTVTNGTGATITAGSLPLGVNGSFNPQTGKFTIAGTPAEAGDFTYTITATGDCSPAAITGTIHVNSNTSLQLTSPAETANQQVCITNNINTITYQSTSSATITINGLPQGVTYTSANGITTLTGKPTQTGTFTYTIIANGTCSVQQLTGTITVNPNPAGFNDIINNLTCSNNSFSYNLQDNVNNTAKGGNAVAASFTWSVAPNPNIQGANNGSGNTIAATLINTSQTPQSVVYTIIPTALTGQCPGAPFTLTVNLPVCSGISITKTASVSTVSKAGDQIIYTITVKNTASANHTNVVVSDPFLGGVLSGPSSGDNGNGILEANESWVYTGTYTVTQDDIDNYGKPNALTGKIINTATVTTRENPVALSASSTVDIQITGSVVLIKTGAITTDFSTVTYTFTVINIGKVRLTNLVLTDPKLGGNIVLSSTTIEAGASITATATYTVTDQEKRDGKVSNTATITGNTPAGDSVSDISGTRADNDDPTVNIIDSAPKAINDNAETKINQPVTFSLTQNDLPSFNGLDAGSIIITQAPLHGQVQGHLDGTVTYTPYTGYYGPDSFTYTVNDLKGVSSNKALVSINVTAIDLFIPNTFTPNGDGKNDVFEIVGIERFDSVDILVFNRWGNEVYRNKNYQNNWDGSNLNEGTYYYLIVLKKGGDQITKKGWILLKR